MGTCSRIKLSYVYSPKCTLKTKIAFLHNEHGAVNGRRQVFDKMFTDGKD